jgi:hypothetical protein
MACLRGRVSRLAGRVLRGDQRGQAVRAVDCEPCGLRIGDQLAYRRLEYQQFPGDQGNQAAPPPGSPAMSPSAPATCTDEPEHGEPGRDLPPEILRQVCDHLGTLTSARVHTAIEILIATGRRP